MATTTPIPTNPTASTSSTAAGSEAPIVAGRSDRSTLRRTTVVVGGAAAVATAAAAAALHAAGVTFEVDGEPIPLLGFGQMAFLWTIVGGVIAGSIRKRSAHARRRWIQVTLGLTALSCLPSVTAPASTGTRAALCLTHLVAAAVVIPVIARRLTD